MNLLVAQQCAYVCVKEREREGGMEWDRDRKREERGDRERREGRERQ